MNFSPSNEASYEISSLNNRVCNEILSVTEATNESPSILLEDQLEGLDREISEDHLAQQLEENKIKIQKKSTKMFAVLATYYLRQPELQFTYPYILRVLPRFIEIFSFFPETSIKAWLGLKYFLEKRIGPPRTNGYEVNKKNSHILVTLDRNKVPVFARWVMAALWHASKMDEDDPVKLQNYVTITGVPIYEWKARELEFMAGRKRTHPTEKLRLGNFRSPFYSLDLRKAIAETLKEWFPKNLCKK